MSRFVPTFSQCFWARHVPALQPYCLAALLVKSWPSLRYELYNSGKFGKGHSLKDYFRSFNSFIQCVVNHWSFNKIELNYGGWQWDDRIVTCLKISGMALQTLAPLAKGHYYWSLTPSLLPRKKKKKRKVDYSKIKKVKIHLDLLPSGNMINSLLA